MDQKEFWDQRIESAGSARIRLQIKGTLFKD